MAMVLLTVICCLQFLALGVHPLAVNNSLDLKAAHNAQGMKVECDAQRFGDGLAEYNCGNAWGKIGTSITPQVFARRPERKGEVALPIRFLSGTFQELILTLDDFHPTDFTVI